MPPEIVADSGTWATGSMPALQFVAPGEMAWTTVEIPEPEAGSILVRVEALGICGTDVHLFTGHSAYIHLGLTTYPFIPGHEFSGTVVALSENVDSVRVGDRVVGEPFLPCGTCRVCRAGLINLCPNRAEQGVRGNISGAAAQFVRVPAANVVTVPAHVPPEYALIAEPSVTVLHALEATGLQPGLRVAVIGSGTLGLIATQVASRAGATVHTIGVDAGLELAAECGAVRLLHPDDAPSDYYDIVIEAAGAPTALGLAIRIAGIGGRISQTGIPGRESSGVAAALIVAKGLTIVGILGGIPYLPRAIQLISEGVIEPAALVGPIRDWSEADAAMQEMITGGMPKPKIVLDLTGLGVDSAVAA